MRTAKALKSEVNYMKPIFTVHAGEYLVGEHIQRICPRWNVWLPAKDTGVDLLVTEPKSRKMVGLQIKFSKDFLPKYEPLFQNRLLATGWWTHTPSKIENSKADFWVFVLPSFVEKQASFIIVPPKELLRRLKLIHGAGNKKIHSYLQVTRTGRCWETRGLPKADSELIALDRFSNAKNANRDFTVFLDGWEQVELALK